MEHGEASEMTSSSRVKETIFWYTGVKSDAAKAFAKQSRAKAI